MKRPGWRAAPAPLMAAVVMAACLLIPLIAADPGPRIVLDPDTAGSGEKVTVFGFNFCGDEGCSLVRIELEEEAVAEEVQVGPDGNFAISFEVQAPPGTHDVFAIQAGGSDGVETRAVAELTLGVGRQERRARRPIPR